MHLRWQAPRGWVLAGSKYHHRILFASGLLSALICLLLYSTQPINSCALAQKGGKSQTSCQRSNYIQASPRRRKLDTTSEIGRASNATLGFERVFALGFKERTDKKDAFVLASSLTGFNVEWMDAVRGDEVPDKALPPGVELKNGTLGCWRGHMNIISKVVQENIASAFIMEDDADWDVRLLSQMPVLAKGVRTLSNISLSKHQHSPYGDDWDIIWPGHCGELPPKDDFRTYIINDDPTVAPKSHQPWLMGVKHLPEGSRVIHRVGGPICAFGYAVSLRGAQKILYWLGIKGGDSLAIDNGLGYMCRNRDLNMNCWSVEPQLFNHHRPAGSISKDSDINQKDPAVIREKAFTDIIVWSARLNLEKMIMGDEGYVKQWE